MALVVLKHMVTGSFSFGIRAPVVTACYQHSVKYSQSSAAPAIDKSLLSKLRKQTGLAFTNCRKALLMHDNDFDKALQWLNDEAAKEGWAKAGKLQNRPMSQGVIGVMTTPSSALLLEVNCETDFVARNVKFLELVANVGHLCFDKLQASQSKKLMLNSDELSTISNTAGESIGDIVAKEVGSIGENLRANRATYMSVDLADSHLAHYIHTAGLNDKCLEIEGCKFGKYTALALLQGNISQDDIAIHSAQIAQHIVGMNPTTIGVIEEVDETAESSPPESDTPEAVNRDSVTPAEDESRLLFQEFLLNPDMTTKQWLDERGLSVADFVRFAVGEQSSW